MWALSCGLRKTSSQTLTEKDDPAVVLSAEVRGCPFFRAASDHLYTYLFVSLFALDSSSSERTFWQNVLAFLKHLIPSFILLASLIIAWKWEKAGGILLTLAGLAFSISVFVLNYQGLHPPETWNR